MKKQTLITKNKRKTIYKFTLYGVLFGCTFPLFALLLDFFLKDILLNWNGILTIHRLNVIHYVVDTAPIVLGLAGFKLGKIHHKKNSINQQLLKVNESLDIFTSKITHDLKGPATQIKALTDLLKRDNLEDQERELFLEKLSEVSDSWLDTFSDFSDLLRQEKAGIREKTHCNLTQTLKKLEAQLKTELEESHTTLSYDFGSIDSVYFHQFDLDSIFKNLITNAIKYCHDERSPVISIKGILTQKHAEISFSDNGMGMDLQTNGDIIFQPFERLVEKKAAKGTGIGLYLVKEQIKSNDGNIEVNSTPEIGTTFTLKLPIS
ncbi:MAG: HAMP domain-containing histidine kinase [Reichenbachiella sp.]